MSYQKLTNAQIAWRAAQDIEDGAYANPRIGFPEMIAKFQPEGFRITYHTENGVLGFGAAPEPGDEDCDLINAGKKAIILKPGASFFHHAASFAMVRGGHLDLAVLGAYQVAQNGDLANWRVGCITRVYTSLAVVDIEGGRFILREKLPSMSLDELQSFSGATLHTDGEIADLTLPELD